jgi:hypothetical protein
MPIRKNFIAVFPFCGSAGLDFLNPPALPKFRLLTAKAAQRLKEYQFLVVLADGPWFEYLGYGVSLYRVLQWQVL